MILGVNNYDPDAEEGRKRPVHMTAKEWRLLGIVLAVVLILLFPVYRYLLQLRNTHVCRQNLLEIANAMEGYCEDNNDRFPPLYMTADDGPEPKVFGKQEVFSWVSLLSSYTKTPEVFACPEASEQEGVTNDDIKGKPLVSDYGMYAALSTLPRGNVADLQHQVLICDSSNEGANGTADPMPFTDAKGNDVPDGMVIGLDSTNFMVLVPGAAANAKLARAAAQSKYATRVAAPDSSKGDFTSKTYTRHPDGINALMGDFHLGHFSGSGINVQHAGKAGAIIGSWATQ